MTLAAWVLTSAAPEPAGAGACRTLCRAAAGRPPADADQTGNASVGLGWADARLLDQKVDRHARTHWFTHSTKPARAGLRYGLSR